MHQPLKKFVIILFLFAHCYCFAQEGGNNTYEFLNLVPSARAAALGGNAIANPSDDASLLWQNPALLRSTMHSQLQLSFADYFDGISFGEIGYASHFKTFGTAAATFHFINYGSFTRTDEAANELGTFSSGEYALSLSYGKALDSLFYLGASLKTVYSDLDIYNSFGLVADLGAIYLSKNKTFCAAFVVHNAGRQITYYNDEKERLPFEMQIGITKQLPNAPFRFGLTYQNLEKFNITYEDPNVPDVDPLTGEPNDKSISFFNKTIRHFVLSTEVLITKGFNVRLGYNFKRRSELSIEDKRGLVGLTAGFGIKISRFKIDYARAVYHIKGASNQFTLGMRLADFKR
jgi:hypothetical protein